MLDYLTIDDLPDTLKDVADAIGIDSFKDLVKFAGGGNLYIPNERSLTKPVRDKMIKESFRGNYRELSQRFGISEVQVRNIIKEI